jgi:sulfate permease, SulP family
VVSLANHALKRASRYLSFPMIARDTMAGTITALVAVVECISYAALIFQGGLSGGFALGLSALLVGTALTAVIVALTTSLVPANGGPDTPAVAVMSVMAAGIAAKLAAIGVTGEEVIVHVMMAITVATLVTGALLIGIGWGRLGIWLRFVPYPVIGGFLAASGYFLVTGGMAVMIGADEEAGLGELGPLFSGEHWPQLLIGVAFAAIVVGVRSRIDSFLVLPITFFVMLVGLDVLLLAFGQAEHWGGRDAWFLESIGAAEFWNPWAALTEGDIRWGVLAASAAEIGAVCGVVALGMLLDVSSLEVARRKSIDLDNELRTNGFANVLTAAAGGAVGNLSLNGSILIKEAGAATRLSGVVVAIVCAIVLFVGTDIASYVPLPLLGGLLVYLGLMILTEALLRSPAQRSWTDLVLALAIMAVIVYAGYLLGVLLGVIGACLLFAFSYSRIGVVRRHLTRQEFASNVERSPGQTRLLREEGARLHVFWLSGFIFFGSSNGLFERIRRCIDAQREKPIGFVVLDFSNVPGLDTSAVLSLVKLRDYCDENGVTLAFSGLTDAMRLGFDGAGFFAEGRPHQVFGSRNEAVEWCEDELLMNYEVDDASVHSFESWLQNEFSMADIDAVLAYLDRQELAAGEKVFLQGQPSDSVVLMASGCVAITIDDEKGRPIRLRRMMGHTVIGEMGFYRKVPRTATVVAEEPTVIYSLTREAFERMQKEDPDAASAFNRLIIKLLADRLEFANREISALL